MPTFGPAPEVELLELSDELLAIIEAGGELVFKGGPDDEAVLCTKDKTYLVRQGLTLFLFSAQVCAVCPGTH